MKKVRKNKTFLITGGTGFIGSNITKLLIEKNYNVKVFDNNSRGKLANLKKLKKKFKFIKGDIRDKKKVLNSCKNVDAVVHLAYINGTKFFYKHPIKILEIAIKGMINIIEGCIKYNIKELYLASSSEVYQTPSKIPTDETEILKIPDIYNPRYSYGGGKILTELMGINYGRKFFKKLIIFRPHNVYGPDMGNEHVIPEFIKRLKNIKDRKFKIQGSGKEIRSFIYIDDFIDAFDLLVKKGKHLEIYNIGTPEKTNIKSLAILISKIINKKINIFNGPLRKGGTKIRVPDISKKKKLGFKQKNTLIDGLKKAIKFYY